MTEAKRKLEQTEFDDIRNDAQSAAQGASAN